MKKALNQKLSVTITIPHGDISTQTEKTCKKIVSNVDNCLGFSEKRYQMIYQIQTFLKEIYAKGYNGSISNAYEHLKGKFDKNKKLSFISDDMLILGCI